MIETLYKRIGGSATINAAVNTFYRKILADPRLREALDEVGVAPEAGKPISGRAARRRRAPARSVES